MSLLFAFGLVFNALQSNAIAESMEVAFGVDRTLMGFIVVAASGAVIFGGARRIGKVAEILVPLMAVIYLLVAVYAIITNIGELPRVFGLIISAAFNPQAALGAAAGVGIQKAMEMGIKRGLFSNEAGMGSAPNAAASASTPHPVNQGLLQMLGVFVDTIIVCSATAFMILLSNAYVPGGELKGIALTQSAVDFHIGSGGSAFLAIAIFLFSFTSIIGNYAYAESNINFIKKNNLVLLTFRLMVLGMVMFGAAHTAQFVWDLADASMAFMALINLVAILLLSKFAFAAWKDYSSQLKSGKEPIFKSESIDGLKGKLMDDSWK